MGTAYEIQRWYDGYKDHTVILHDRAEAKEEMAAQVYDAVQNRETVTLRLLEIDERHIERTVILSEYSTEPREV